MILFYEQYDETLDLLDAGCCSVFIPVIGGVYRAVFAPANTTVQQRMLNDPIRFAITATHKTRLFAESKGYLTEE